MSRVLKKKTRGSFEVKKSWVKPLLQRMNFVKRKCSNTGKMIPSKFASLKENFINDICAEVLMNGIPDNLIFNWDHTGICIHLLPIDDCTME